MSSNQQLVIALLFLGGVFWIGVALSSIATSFDETVKAIKQIAKVSKE